MRKPAVSTVTQINPLANPKGVKLLCELCGKPAYLRCDGCRVTYYCDKEHQVSDWKSIHERVCSLLIPLRTPVSILGSEEERAHREQQVRTRYGQLHEIATTEAHKKLFEGEYVLAIPAALQSLRSAIQIHGPDAAQLIPSYLLLGESSIGLGQLSQAEEYLSLARWALMKRASARAEADGGGGGVEHRSGEPGEPVVDVEAKAQRIEDAVVEALLNRNFGLLWKAKKKYTEARDCFAADIYFSSLVKNDPEHVSVTGGYFHLATVFQALNQLDTAQSLFELIVRIWFDTLLKVRHVEESASSLPSTPEVSGQEYVVEENDTILDEAQEAEGIQMLTTIVGDSAIASPQASAKLQEIHAKALHLLAILYARYERMDDQSVELISQAETAHQETNREPEANSTDGLAHAAEGRDGGAGGQAGSAKAASHALLAAKNACEVYAAVFGTKHHLTLAAVNMAQKL
ncbi:uncharacterized protein EV422DRAFT_317033 [Fimicolochytrium jonesii]|uniref:uncharacterized protein n=1 Tax=Fimicolochytrium jonesii TaxID=1396493 RepID=UPI0022FE2737|nr:uncharacterized protein EV422DRAFT_317033 [Fimicolochytrium jonesii]KAI8824334.1 hypothetical protein EV422DRAFT_317033 [Fimicolochytrium jonesii]